MHDMCLTREGANWVVRRGDYWGQEICWEYDAFEGGAFEGGGGGGMFWRGII